MCLYHTFVVLNARIM